MNFTKYFVSLTLALSLAVATSYAAEHHGHHADQESEHEEELNTRDSQIIRTYLKTKAANKQGEISNLIVSGDLRSEWNYVNERYRYKELRGSGAYNPCEDCLPISRNDFDVEFNLRFEYVTEKAWAAAHLQFDNSCGVSNNKCCCNACDRGCKFESESSSSSSSSSSDDSGFVEGGESGEPEISEKPKKCAFNRFHGSGQGGDIDLKRAFVGYNIYECGDSRFDVEIGRRKMYDIFESEIQFLSRFDGVLFQYSDSTENFADWYVKLAGFLVDERTNHFGWATEIGFFDLWNSKLDLKYCFVDWTKRGRSRCAPLRSISSSSSSSFESGESGIVQESSSSSNGLDDLSHRDRCGGHNPRGFKYRNSQLILTYHFDPSWLCRPTEIYAAGLWNHACKSQNHHHKRKGLGAYAGITIGQVKKEGDWSIDLQYQYVEESAIAFDDENGIGLLDTLADCCNVDFPPGPGYKGWRLEALYAITDNLSVDSVLEYADSTEHVQHRYWKFKVETIYAF